MHGDPRGLQVTADGLATDRERLLDAPKRPTEPTEGKNLLLRGVVQDIAHAATELAFRADVNVSIATGNGRFQLSINGRFRVSTEDFRNCRAQRKRRRSRASAKIIIARIGPTPGSICSR